MSNSSSGGFANTLFAAIFAVIGYHIHGSVFWTVIDFLFWPIALIKWLCCHQLTHDVLVRSFPFLFS